MHDAYTAANLHDGGTAMSVGEHEVLTGGGGVSALIDVDTTEVDVDFQHAPVNTTRPCRRRPPSAKLTKKVFLR